MTTRRGILLVPAFPRDSFWSYQYILRWIGRKAAFPPLGLISFAAYLPPEWDLELVDLNTTHMSESELRRRMAAADAAFVGAMSIQKRSLLDILEAARGLPVPFVLGGPFASSYRDQILQPQSASDQRLHDGLDVLVWGEAQSSMHELLAYLASEPRHSAETPRLLIPQAVGAASADRYLMDRTIFRPLDDVPLPRWDLLRVRDYQSMMIQTSAGCPFRCEFCDIIRFNGGFARVKPPAQVRRELDAILATGYRGSVFSVDDNFIGAPAAMSAVLDAMIEFQRDNDYPFSFYTQASVNLGTPALEPLLEKMRTAGFDAVFLGIENPSPEALRGMNKKQNLKLDLSAAVATIQRAGIEVYGGFIFGSDADTPESADRIVEFISRNRIFSAMAGMLTPIPHTPLYERLNAEGRLHLDEFTGNNTDDRVQFEPRLMSAEQLGRGMASIVRRLFQEGAPYARALAMLQGVQPQIFNRGKRQWRYVRAALTSMLRQGILHADRRYFQLLRQATRLDMIRKRAARRELRTVRRLPDEVFLSEAGERWLSLARDYAIRFRPEISLARIDEWTAALRRHLEAGTIKKEQLRVLRREAMRCLEVRIRQHRFPGLAVRRAFDAALKSFHYQRVAQAVGRQLY